MFILVELLVSIVEMSEVTIWAEKFNNYKKFTTS